MNSLEADAMAPPDPSPNSVVKPGNADGPPWATARESRTPPDLFSQQLAGLLEGGGLFFAFFRE
jgi:hypothetical protein